jgi:hypothetical protein
MPSSKHSWASGPHRNPYIGGFRINVKPMERSKSNLDPKDSSLQYSLDWRIRTKSLKQTHIFLTQ